jgi:Putative transposase/Transposase zinc-binding domain
MLRVDDWLQRFTHGVIPGSSHTLAQGISSPKSTRPNHTRTAYNSCRNRHCPKCQWPAAEAWMASREAELLPVPYFHVVFTLPAALGAIAYQNKAKLYGLLFTAAAETLTTIAGDPKHLGADIGVTAVLHTWGQNLQHHPHVHCIVPGGGLSPHGERWIACRNGFFLPVRVLSRLFRRLFLQGLEAMHAVHSLDSCPAVSCNEGFCNASEARYLTSTMLMASQKPHRSAKSLRPT